MIKMIVSCNKLCIDSFCVICGLSVAALKVVRLCETKWPFKNVHVPTFCYKRTIKSPRKQIPQFNWYIGVDGIGDWVLGLS